ncbi:uncharacterized protein LOC126762800 [Bactrocera neohumeralis]|nr:uncharacterized protein LOC125775486 isoform X2 [Bactrocera dorsalis]XP_049315771.1 uncharacterized protein LOC125779172 [Bactrocera dorsalis]XP_050321019.1 uncharacterized protein LOC126753542 isoform X2 [Bactrocera neohumeralis]XP_050335801.1 uncharacterized protein LOC126762800 [Bactrocera neohumeralis]
MAENPDLAAGFSKQGKDRQEALWKETAADLNSAGPPTKTVSEWKRVWNDQKRYVRKKLTFNAEQIRGTGGGPNLHHKLSTSEETIVAITGMTNSVEGLEGIVSHGFQPLSTTESELDAETIVNKSPQQTPKRNPFLKDAPSSSKRKGTSVILEEEIEVQKEILKRIRRIEDNTRALNKNFTILNNLKEEELKELKNQTIENKRHNIEIENLRKREIKAKLEKTRRLIEIEEMKLSMMKR